MSNKSKAKSKMLGIDAVILIARDFDQQCNFYEQVLGLDLVAHYGDAAFFKVGSQKLGIFARSHHREGTRRLSADHGISHLEFRIDKDAREEFTTRLIAAGSHAYGDNFADVDGNLFHFTEPQ